MLKVEGFPVPLPLNWASQPRHPLKLGSTQSMFNDVLGDVSSEMASCDEIWRAEKWRALRAKQVGELRTFVSCAIGELLKLEGWGNWRFEQHGELRTLELNNWRAENIGKLRHTLDI